MVTSLLRLEPEPIARLAAALPEAVRRRIDLEHRMPAPLAPIRLPPQSGEAVAAALAQFSPATEQWLAALREADTSLAGGRAARLREERDAVALAIDISGVAAPDNLLYTPGDGLDTGAAFGATFNPLYVMDNEDDLLAEDLRRFDPRSRLQLRSASVARFTSDQLALTVMNVNRKPLEEALGVDLVYYDEKAQIFTLVQYKRMTRRATGQDGRAAVGLHQPRRVGQAVAADGPRSAGAGELGRLADGAEPVLARWAFAA